MVPPRLCWRACRIKVGDKSGTKSGLLRATQPTDEPPQRNALTRLSSRYLVDVPHGELSTSVAVHAHADWAAQFGRPVDELLVEIGSGTGDALVASALANPEALFGRLGRLMREPWASTAPSWTSRGGQCPASLMVMACRVWNG